MSPAAWPSSTGSHRRCRQIPTLFSAHVTELVADLVEPAKATALEKLGEGEQAQRIAIGWLRPKLLLATPA